MNREEKRREKSERLLDAIGQIDEDLIEEARTAGPKQKRTGSRKAIFRIEGVLAACALLVVCVGLYRIREQNPVTPAPDVTRALQAHQSEKAARGIGEETAELAEETGQDDAGEYVASGVAPASLDGDTAAGQEVSGIILEADGGSVTFLLSNGTDQKVSYGAAFGLERLEEGVWRMVEPIGEIAWEDVLYELSPGEQAEDTAELSGGYGRLEPGKYRLVKRYSVSGQEGELPLYLEFTVDDRE